MSRFILVTNDTSLEQRVTRAISGGLAGSLQTLRNLALPETPHELLALGQVDGQAEVVILGADVATEDAFRLASVFDIQMPEVSLVLVADIDPELALQAMRAGIRDILSPTADAETIRVHLELACRSASRKKFPDHSPSSAIDGGRVIIIASPKGGVGKTTIATNVAVALGRVAPMSTVLVDLDSQFGDVASALQLTPEHTLTDAVLGAAKQDSMVLKAFLSVHHSSIYALCAPISPAEADRIGADDITHLIDQLASEFRYVVIDTAPGLGEQALAAFEKATDAVLVCTMDVPSVRGLRKEIDVLDQLGLVINRRQVIVNFADSSAGLTIRDIEATIGTPVDLVIPRTRDVASSTDRGVPLLQHTNRGKAAKALTRLANHFDPAHPVRARKGIHKRAELT
ncbi:MAG: AAA family ATPase [Candidatus Saccharibacteria bacterium]|nr:AAA family ATPase [Microbacteriaceae bacterium]